uniref:Uncharacterized protein n=1 Tax=Anguilla anguilla TaxID=7936 RepID=A0A0E9XBS6_ANGAN
MFGLIKRKTLFKVVKSQEESCLELFLTFLVPGVKLT